MKYKFVDIGTAYFCTSVDKFGLEVNGIFVEPVKDFLDTLPNSPTIIKANYAVSDSEREDIMFVPINNRSLEYHSEKELLKINSRFLIGHDGCSCLGNQHPEVSQGFQKIKCNVITFYKLCELYNIKEIEFLKLDTEGHDFIILEQVYNLIKSGELIISKQIFCEYNYLIHKGNAELIIRRFEKELGFTREIKGNIWGQQDLILTKNGDGQ